MAFSFSLKHVFFSIVLLTLAHSCCKVHGQGQGLDAVQIVATSALCFDNRTIIQNCLATLGFNATTNSSSNLTTTNGFCDGPCYGQTMLVISCIDGILSNFQFYNAQMMQGVRSIFQAACGKNNSANATDGSGNVEAVANYGSEVGQLSTWIMGILVSVVWLV
ncbi:uncharacterized protein LOC120273028 [Dioscorea cayenensis subsp. rotundata]|uniref:Uncharacterized protein LOC120273028 n=1 Tax=Dioscorea cayennensis subsp. rotundata TaxID=55577 RepID=A0AB40C744_DIOCR|nr:uncharacterized protein LOC120273028 [Dioscorea cayenensis subsp. rotundata]